MIHSITKTENKNNQKLQHARKQDKLIDDDWGDEDYSSTGIEPDDPNYIQFPLFLMQEFWVDHDSAIEKILAYGYARYYESKGVKDTWYGLAEEVRNKIQPGEPMPMATVAQLESFRGKEKSEFEKAQLAGFIAIKSIIGSKHHTKTNKQHITARMFGYASIKAIPENLPAETKHLLTKYSQRYHIDRLIQQLELSWHVITYSNHTRGLYIAVERLGMDRNRLAVWAERNKQKVKEAKLKEEKAAAKKWAMEMLKKESKPNEAREGNYHTKNTIDLDTPF